MKPDRFINSTTSMEQATKQTIGFLNMPSLCRSHGIPSYQFFTTAPPLSMKTDSGFVLMRILQRTVIRKETSTEAFFECTATIDDVVHGSPWYYISCSGCHTKATKGPTSLMCGKCGKVLASIFSLRYRAKISVYDNSDQAVLYFLVMLVTLHQPQTPGRNPNNASLEEAVGIANKESQTASSLGDEGSKRTVPLLTRETAKRKSVGIRATIHLLEI
ncbi:hypothetical protein Bca52824_008130 [Brassica carinata]|uniref:Replication factor A C-terminal domain-containing protein n=1 Tax=Brassica carinata TaxID=52824 RepID=A0A8X8B8I2_BRACI|nr:hypothetical protein Bca52824_008130 [Brassica carinata]